jgi:hypothetical protein
MCHYWGKSVGLDREGKHSHSKTADPLHSNAEVSAVPRFHLRPGNIGPLPGRSSTAVFTTIRGPNPMSEPHRLAIPAELEELTHEPCLMHGESRREFETIRWMIIDDICPKTNIEWLWTLDLVELSWEILRYRCLKKKILEGFRMAAVESLLRRVDGCRPKQRRQCATVARRSTRCRRNRSSLEAIRFRCGCPERRGLHSSPGSTRNVRPFDAKGTTTAHDNIERSEHPSRICHSSQAGF